MTRSNSVLDVIVEIMRNSPNETMTLQKLYEDVPKTMKKDISRDLVRGSITRRTEGTKPGPYRIMFKRVKKSTYKLLK
jgi:hypothetical protein